MFALPNSRDSLYPLFERDFFYSFTRPYNARRCKIITLLVFQTRILFPPWLKNAIFSLFLLFGDKIGCFIMLSSFSLNRKHMVLIEYVV